MGAVSAADDVSTDAVDASVDDAVDEVSEDTSDSTIVEETSDIAETTVSEDTSSGEINDNSVVIKENDESLCSDSEESDVVSDRAMTYVRPLTWNSLRSYCQSTTDQQIKLYGITYNANDNQIVFANSATIIGTGNSYISGGNSITPFLNTNNNLTITFIKVKFRNMNVNNLLELAGTKVFENCSFYNITAGTGHNSVVYNTYGTMSLIGCNITNSSAGYGVVSNYNSGTVTGVVMNVDNCKFINNSASVEPGVINNCGILYVDNSEFTNNSAGWWAGAIHTHSNAQTYIDNSNFTGNVAGWNGGALYTYSKLVVSNSIFKENKCHTSAGGGAIGCSNYGSAYNITISNCTFEENENLCGHTNETPSTGTGGAISAMNNGILNVYDSTFVHNVAAFGQAIAAYSQGYISPEGNISEGIPKVIISNNVFTNHTLNSSDTVELSGNYTFENNTFNNCHQTNLGTNNVFNDPVYLNNVLPFDDLSVDSKQKNTLLSSNPLGDMNEHSEFYINISSDNDPESDDIDGQSWEKAYGTEMCWEFVEAFQEGNGVIHFADGDYSFLFEAWDGYMMQRNANMSYIGQGPDTILNKIDNDINYGSGGFDNIHTFINLTIQGGRLGRHSNFIDCTFINNATFTILKMASEIGTQTQIDESDFPRTYTLNFTNCIFKDVFTEGSLFDLYKYGKLNFTNCIFENITADSLVHRNGEFIFEDGIYLYDCKFINCNIKGVADIPGDIEILDYCAIENCDYDFDATTNVVSDDEHAHNYLNATKLAKPDTTLVADVDDAGNLLVNLTAGGNAVANGKVLISVNGAEAVSYDLGEDGTLSIALSDLTDATGKLDIAVSFEETDDYKGSSDTISTVLVVKTVTEKIDPVATSITASDITATAKIAKTLSITLKDASGNALANKAVKVTVNGKTSTVTTDKNGVAKVTVNYAKAGTYYYTFNYLGDNDYKASLKPVKVTVNKQATKATFAKKTFKVKATKKISFTLKDSKGKAIAKKKITFKVNGKTYTAKTNSKGVATVKIVIKKKGKYTATAKFAGDTTYKAISKKATITIR